MRLGVPKAHGLNSCASAKLMPCTASTCMSSKYPVRDAARTRGHAWTRTDFRALHAEQKRSRIRDGRHRQGCRCERKERGNRDRTGSSSGIRLVLHRVRRRKADGISWKHCRQSCVSTLMATAMWQELLIRRRRFHPAFQGEVSTPNT